MIGKIYSEYDPNVTIIRKKPEDEGIKQRLSDCDKIVFKYINNMYKNGADRYRAGISAGGIRRFLQDAPGHEKSIKKIYDILDNTEYVEQLLQKIEYELQKKSIDKITKNDFANEFAVHNQYQQFCADSDKFYKIFLLTVARARVENAMRSNDSAHRNRKLQSSKCKDDRELQFFCANIIKEWRRVNSIKQDKKLSIKQRSREIDFVVSSAKSIRKRYNCADLKRMYNDIFGNKTLNEIQASVSSYAQPSIMSGTNTYANGTYYSSTQFYPQ